MTNVRIRKTEIDLDDPCTAAKKLRGLRIQIVAGGQTEVVRFGDDEVRYGKANIAALDREIERLTAECQSITGGTRRRYAKRIRFC
ncbi:hypothetical protein [Ochrobactrum sp. S1502_03]|uniref:hypothetical protein n=1 Tax=Ochrobactrum sp. S1502_03 TaxID=3108451 RepID=UPI0037CB48BC